ncbi:hypothetical protein NMY22_g3082 [Coprinellus aureogranulatus]|nr:hypothetical protein NMY22_g3082 [Coprinellus aureogranulatus]
MSGPRDPHPQSFKAVGSSPNGLDEAAEVVPLESWVRAKWHFEHQVMMLPNWASHKDSRLLLEGFRVTILELESAPVPGVRPPHVAALPNVALLATVLAKPQNHPGASFSLLAREPPAVCRLLLLCKDFFLCSPARWHSSSQRRAASLRIGTRMAHSNDAECLAQEGDSPVQDDFKDRFFGAVPSPLLEDSPTEWSTAYVSPLVGSIEPHQSLFSTSTHTPAFVVSTQNKQSKPGLVTAAKSRSIDISHCLYLRPIAALAMRQPRAIYLTFFRRPARRTGSPQPGIVGKTVSAIARLSVRVHHKLSLENYDSRRHAAFNACSLACSGPGLENYDELTPGIREDEEGPLSRRGFLLDQGGLNDETQRLYNSLPALWTTTRERQRG